MFLKNLVNVNIYLIKGTFVRDIFNNHIRKLSLRDVGVVAEDFLALFLGSDCEYSIKAGGNDVALAPEYQLRI